MKFLKEIKPFEEKISLHASGQGRLNNQDAKEIDSIFHEFVITTNEKIYPNNKRRNKVDLSCNSCVSDMVNLVFNWIRILKEKEENKPKKYKAVKEATVDSDRMKEEYGAETSMVKINIDESKCVKDLEENAGWANNPDLSEEAKIAHLREQLKELGVKYHHKAKSKSLQKLLDKHSK